MKGSRKKMWVLKMWNAHVQVQTWMTWWWSFYASGATLESWAICESTCELCVHWDNYVQRCEQFCEQLNRETHYQLERQERQTEQGNCTKTFVVTFSHMLGTSNSDSKPVLSLNVSGQWSREYQPLCFPHLDSLDSQSHVLGFALNKQQQRGRGLTVTLARVLWECPD